MKTLILSIITLLSVTAHASDEKRVLMIINEGFQVNEYFEPKLAFESVGFKVKTASRYGELTHPGRSYSNYKPVQADLSFNEINLSEYDVITFSGGAGAWTDYFPNKTLHKVLGEALQKPQMVVGLICAGTGLLATANNLDGKTPIVKGRHVTGYFEVEGLLRTLGQVQYDAGDASKPYVVRDGNLITGRDPSSSKLFAETIIQLTKNIGSK